MKCVYRAESLVDARLYADCLRGNGVPCEIFQENAVGALGELPVIGPEVWVRRNGDAGRARRLVEMLERSLAENQSRPPSRCGHCGETSPAGFDLCWRCGHGL